ncbi:hypothetical protein LPTSP4_00210 [Leptospira ryugenii]|uniref:SCP domain-containing protein n=1 Tax=Leptospira ryugenii TaxID=1917863 RepID=A0A2P2DV62_9LEPT|nr:Ig-like domain-containing protein [Leptospira ryugenii]GBF48522.1 hypothetical protein LPTSP4_00210 [Leptospira ryugenii]
MDAITQNRFRIAKLCSFVILIWSQIHCQIYSQSSDISEDEYRKLGLRLLTNYLSSQNFPPPKLDDRLNLTALKHGEYLTLNQNYNPGYEMNTQEALDWIHKEKPGLPGFIGETPNDQAIAMGFKPANGCGVVNTVLPIMQKSQRNSPEFLLRGLLDTPFHRSMVFNPAIKRIGLQRVDYENGKLVLVYFAEICVIGEKKSFVVYPGANDKMIRLRMPPELPNPFPSLPYLSYSSAVSIQLFFDEDPKTELYWEEAILLDPNGEKVPISLLSLENPPPDTEAFLRGLKFVAFVSNAPFQPNTTYTVKAKVKDGNGKQVFQKVWKFTTEPEDSFDRMYTKNIPNVITGDEVYE